MQTLNEQRHGAAIDGPFDVLVSIKPLPDERDKKLPIKARSRVGTHTAQMVWGRAHQGPTPRLGAVHNLIGS